jgi:DNA modification methylase
MITILQGDVTEQLKTLPDCSVQCVVTSPPYYGLRNYGIDGQIGMENTPELFVAKIVEVFREVRRVLRDDGTLWLNFGDSYCGSWGNSGRRPELDNTPSEQREKNTEYFNRGGWDERRERPASSYNIPGYKPKDLFGIPWMVAFALRADGWYLRSDIIWSKPNPMPESVTDRPTKAHEYVFLLTKKAKYYYDADAVREEPEQTPKADINNYGGVGFTDHKNDLTMGMSQYKQTPRVTHPAGRNRRTVWEIATQPTPEAHFATFPEALVEPCIKAGSKIGDIILDPFGGSGTTAKVARDLKRSCILIELNPAYVKIMKNKLRLNEQLQRLADNTPLGKAKVGTKE